MNETIEFQLNGRPVQVSTDPERLLLWVLRTALALTGAKDGCGIGAWRACTVIVGRNAVRPCLVPMKDIRSQEVLAIEGLAGEDALHPLQKAFLEHSALQCGNCTPGTILRAYALLLQTPPPRRGHRPSPPRQPVPALCPPNPIGSQ